MWVIESPRTIAARQKMVAARTADQIALRAKVADLLYKTRDGGMTPSLLKSLRVNGAALGWAEEAQMVRMTGAGTRAWIPAEITELLDNGRVDDYTPHHINSVKPFEWMAGNPNNIQIVERWSEHGMIHGGNTQIPTEGELINRSRMMIDWLNRK
jgi:hypothetical protein